MRVGQGFGLDSSWDAGQSKSTANTVTNNLTVKAKRGSLLCDPRLTHRKALIFGSGWSGRGPLSRAVIVKPLAFAFAQSASPSLSLSIQQRRMQHTSFLCSPRTSPPGSVLVHSCFALSFFLSSFIRTTKISSPGPLSHRPQPAPSK